MRALVCDSWRDFDALELRDIPRPPMRPGAVRIRVEATGVSFAAQLVVAGKYQRRPPLPFVPGTEAVGTVLEGPLPIGMRVFAVLDWGAFAEEAVVDAIHVVPIPEGMPLEPAVAFPISYPTAASALLWRGRVQPGDWVLVHGAAGGVGLAGVEILKAVGARVIARAGVEGIARAGVEGNSRAGVEGNSRAGVEGNSRAGVDKHAMLRARGADAVLDSAVPFRDAVRDITAGAGVACVLDTIGGDVFDESLRCLGDGGTLVTVGYAGGRIPNVPANILLLKNIAVAGLNWGTYVGWSPGDGREAHAPRVRALWDQLMQWWAEGQLRPEVHAAFPLAQFRMAMAEVRGRRAAGRVVLLPGQ